MLTKTSITLLPLADDGNEHQVERVVAVSSNMLYLKTYDQLLIRYALQPAKIEAVSMLPKHLHGVKDIFTLNLMSQPSLSE